MNLLGKVEQIYNFGALGYKCEVKRSKAKVMTRPDVVKKAKTRIDGFPSSSVLIIYYWTFYNHVYSP